jgi:hypothetical protein
MIHGDLSHEFNVAVGVRVVVDFVAPGPGVTAVVVVVAVLVIVVLLSFVVV